MRGATNSMDFGSIVWVACIVLVAVAGGGCTSSNARLWADTALPSDEFSAQRRQWAYDGEPVTFELMCDPSASAYVVFNVEGKETVVNTPKTEGCYRWTHVFHCGVKPQTFEVYALPMLMHGRCDWIYDKSEDRWYHYPGVNEKFDIQTDSEQMMKITCYRVEMHLRFAGRGSPPANVSLTLLKENGERTAIPRRKAEKAGFLLLGPDAANFYEVVYEPQYTEVARTGKTHAELVVEHADGATQRIQKDFDTP